MKERAQELKAQARRGPRANNADGESAVLAKIAEMHGLDRTMAKRLHAIVKASAPALSDLFRAQGVDRRRREKDPRAREESGELRTEPALTPGSVPGRDGAVSVTRARSPREPE